MDVTPASNTFKATGAYPAAAPAFGSPTSAPNASTANSTSVANAASAGTPESPAAQEIDDAPSPSPQAIAADTKDLPANVRYAPSAAPHDSSIRASFDRRA